MANNKGKSKPNLFGGYTHYDEKGHKVGRSDPGFFGGYTNYDARGHKIGRSEETWSGGLKHYDNHGHVTGRSERTVWGGYVHYDSKNKQVGRSNPGFSGFKNSDGGTDGCYIATCVYGSYDCPEVWLLRRFRDDYLKKTTLGRNFVRAYYATSPTLVRWFGGKSWFRELWLCRLNKLIALLRSRGMEDTPYFLFPS